MKNNLINILDKIQWLYFKPRNFETIRFYEKIGVRIFKKFLPTMGDYLIRLTNYHCVEGKRDIKLMEFISRIYELTHVVIFIFVTISIIESLFDHNYKNAFFLCLLNIIVNIYPIMTQRYNRIRLLRIIERMDK